MEDASIPQTFPRLLDAVETEWDCLKSEINDNTIHVSGPELNGSLMLSLEEFWNRYHDLLPWVALACLVGVVGSTLHDVYFRRGNDRIAIAGIVNLVIGALLFCTVVIGMAFHNATFSPRSIIWILGTFALVFLKKVLLVHFKIIKGHEARRARNSVLLFWLLAAIPAAIYMLVFMN